MDKIRRCVEVQYYEDIMENFLKASNTVKQFGGIVIVFLLIICLVLISNTIKTRVYRKKKKYKLLNILVVVIDLL